MKNISLSLLILLVPFLSLGCATSGFFGTPGVLSRAFSEEGIPDRKYLVGGGFGINYTAPADGTAYWVEETTSRILETHSLEKGEKFQVDGDIDPELFEQVMGIPADEVRLTLYFIPVTRP